MRVLQVIPYYEPAWGFGGPVVVCSILAKELVKRGHTLTVLTTDAFDKQRRIKKNNTTINGVKVCRLPNLSTYLAKEQNIYLPKGLKKWLSNNICNFDIVHIHSFFTVLTLLSALVCIKKSIPYVVHLHESPIPSSSLGRATVKQIFNFLWGKRILRHAKKIIVVSERERSLLVKAMPWLKERVEVVYNPVEECGDMVTKAQARRKLLVAPKAKLVICVSRLTIYKKIDALIAVFVHLLKQDSNYRLMIVGGSERGEKERLASIARNAGVRDKMKFCGYVKNSLVRKYYLRGADVFVSLSSYESFGVNAVEALYSGLPVCVSSNVVSVAHKIDKAGCGVTIKNVQNYIQVAQAIDGLIAKKIDRRAFRTVIKDFEPSVVLNKIEHIYKEII
jgi:glycosyltransferase involved in cell wall biosynthesis